MIRRALRPIAPFAAAIVMFSGPARGDVLLVGGAGADYSEILNAVAAASDGDVIRVRAGTYERFAVDDKSLQIVGVEGGVIVNGLVRLRNMSPSRSLHVSGLEFRSLDDEALFLYDNAGQIVLQDCTVLGRDASSAGDCVFSLPAAAIEDSDQVVLIDCTIEGGSGDSAYEDEYLSIYCWGVVDGSGGLSVYDSKVAVFGGLIRGGDGAGTGDTDYLFGGIGGDGLFVGSGADIWISGATIRGGDGAQGSPENGLPNQYMICGNGGKGGDAIELGELSGGSVVTQLGNTLVAGAGGLAGYHYSNPGYPYECTDGSDGIQVRTASGNTVQNRPGSARRIDAATYATDQDMLELTIEGVPGDRVSLALSPRDAYLPRPRGVTLLATPRLTSAFPVGTIPAGGVLVVDLPQRELPVAHRSFGAQASITDAAGRRHLTNVRWITVVDD